MQYFAINDCKFDLRPFGKNKVAQK